MRLFYIYGGGRDGFANKLNKQWTLCHREFHDALAVGCNSQQLLEVRYLLLERSERYRRISAAHRISARSSRDEHREIMEATLSRDVARSVDLIKAHIRLTADFLRQQTIGAEPYFGRKHLSRNCSSDCLKAGRSLTTGFSD